MATFQGQLVITGNGTDTDFSIPHGLTTSGTNPTPYASFADDITKQVSADYGNFDLTADDAKVWVKFANAPTQGVVLTYNVAAIQ